MALPPARRAPPAGRSPPAGPQRLDAPDLSAHGVRVYARSPQALPAASARPAPPVHAVSAAQVDQAWKAASTHSARTSASALPEDGTLHLSALLTAGTLADGLAAVGQREGFAVVTSSAFQTPFASPWYEDLGDFHTDGSVSVAAPFVPLSVAPGAGRAAQLTEAGAGLEVRLLLDRLRRLHGVDSAELTPQLAKQHPDVLFPTGHAVGYGDHQRALVAAAQALNAKVRAGQTYVEGGNLLLGTHQGRPYAVVGEDSVAATRWALSARQGRKISRQEALAAIAQEKGLHPRDLYPVEQPGDFHLDMSMMLLPGKRVLLNDADAAAAVVKKWVSGLDPKTAAPPFADLARRLALLTPRRRELVLERLAGESARRAALEERCAQSLEAQGFQVERVPGALLDPLAPLEYPFIEKFAMNFLNGEAATNGRGERYLVLPGGDPQLEANFARQLLKAHPGTDRVYFLDPVASHELLRNAGGVGCSTKVMAGEV